MISRKRGRKASPKLVGLLLLLAALPLRGEVRIVSGAPNLTEIVLRLGRGPSLVGVSDFCPPGPPRVAGLRVRWESVLARRPTHLLLLPTQADPAGMAAIRRAGVKALVLPFEALADIPRNTRSIGEFLGAPDEAEALARAFDEALAALPILPARRTAYVLWWSPPVTAGPSSFIGEGLRRLGLEPGPSARTGFPTVPVEELLAWAPSLVLYPADAGPPPEWLAARSGVRCIEVPADRWNRPALDFPAALADLAHALGD